MLLEKGKTLEFGSRDGESNGFKMPVPASIEGTTAEGQRFKEMTGVSFISHVGAVVRLQNQAGLGTRVRMSIALPPGLSGGKDLSLVIKGEVVDTGHDPDGPGTKVAIRFESRYIVEESGT